MLDITLWGALLGGLLSFLTPCVLPMVPFYLGYLAGGGVHQVAAGGAVSPALRARAMAGSFMFAAGVITIFVALGASASVLGQLVRDWFDVLRWIAAAMIIAMGLHFLGVVRIGFLNRQFRADAGDVRDLSLAGAYVVGLAFAFGWTPCVGPALAAILFVASASDTAARGALLLFVYGVGMTLPFIVAAAFIGPFMRFMRRFRRHLHRVEQAMGALLIVFGILIATNSVNYIAQWMIDVFPVFLRFG